jgi:hypothetical protein
MDAYEIVPLWIGLWLLAIIAADVYFRLKRNPTFRTLLLHFRIWEMALLMLLFVALTTFEKTSMIQTLLLMGGPFLSLLPITHFFIKRRKMLQDLASGQ